MIYVGFPYTDDDEFVRATRMDRAISVATIMTEKGLHVYLPVLVARHVNKSRAQGHDFWITQDMEVIRRLATSLLILPLDGWKTSKGLTREIAAAKILNIPIMSPSFYDLPPPTTGIDYDASAWWGGKSFFEHVNQV